MGYLGSFLGIFLIAFFLIPIVGINKKGIVAILATMGFALVSSIVAIKALAETSQTFILKGSFITGQIPLVMDSLAAWFVLLINFTAITAAVYGYKYMQAYKNMPARQTLHWISYLIAHAALLAICLIQNSIAFLVAWELMMLSTFFMVIYESHKTQTLRAGLNYLIQSHVGIIILTVSFIWIATITDSFSFSAISEFVETQSHAQSFILMLLFFVGFGIKAGFVPFHTWLPLAHPAAPSHVSGFMSGILIKIGIYGILRMLLQIQVNYLAVGYFILAFSTITGLYGVMLAIVQHNLKKLLAYHSIENIGIIGMGIGIGCIGLGISNSYLAWLGFAGALLHTLNHALFKSLLFYGAGNIHQSTHTMSIDRLGGLVKQMPHTTVLFLIGALAISGLPPFNGFISEFIIYSGFLKGIQTSAFPNILVFVVALFSLAMIGGLAILCFTKAFGSIFLGTARHSFNEPPAESSWQKLFPMYLVVVLMVAIGLFPQIFVSVLNLPVTQFTGQLPLVKVTPFNGMIPILSRIGLFSTLFIVLTGTIYFVRKKLQKQGVKRGYQTWACAYVAPNKKMQYTASSFVRNYRKLAEPLLSIQKITKNVEGVFPAKAAHQTHPKDKSEEFLIIRPLRNLRVFMSWFLFLQNGRLQFYILYGMVFIMLLTGIPFIIYIVGVLVKFLNTI
jgi:formate hydrogenlyase subunit 3/multisubunit Na+/H+ antiporter MnhD subunit